MALTSIRESLVNRIRELTTPSDIGRYVSLYEFLTKAALNMPQDLILPSFSRKHIRLFRIEDFNFDLLSDDELVQAFELTCRRASAQR